MESAKFRNTKLGELAHHILFSTKAQAKENEVSEADALYATQVLNDDTNFLKLINATRVGLPYQSFKNAQHIMPFSLQEWSAMLHISTRSIDRLKKERKQLSSTQSEKLIEVTLLFDYGVHVFGDSTKFSKWLNRNNIALGGLNPKSLLDTNQGIKAVKAELSKIEYGVLA